MHDIKSVKSLVSPKLSIVVSRRSDDYSYGATRNYPGRVTLPPLQQSTGDRRINRFNNTSRHEHDLFQRFMSPPHKRRHRQGNSSGVSPATGFIGKWKSADGVLGEKSVGKIPLRWNRLRPERWSTFERVAK